MDLIAWIAQQVLDLHRQIHQELSIALRTLNSDGGAFLRAAGVAFVLGMVHALTPGHGKAILFSYFLGRRVRPWDGMVTAAQVAGLHIGTAAKPACTWKASYAYWRFINLLRLRPHLTLDHGVLLRQAVRWSGDRLFVGTWAPSLEIVARKCGITLSAGGELRTMPYGPAWLVGDQWPAGHGLDDAPSQRLPDEEVPAEPWMWSMGQQDGLRSWHSAAQKEACWQVLTAHPGSTTLIGLPTGAGKSLIFQLAARFSAGVTVVVVPTVALAIDQWTAACQMLRAFPHIAPRYYAADDRANDPESVCLALREGKCRLLFTSPEACVSGRLRHVITELAKQGRLDNLVVDEAHIIDSWGGHFRVEFQLLSIRRRQWLEMTHKRLRTILLSATFTPECQAMLKQMFGGADWREFACQRLRPEMNYARQQLSSSNQQDACVLEALKNLPRPLILYVTERAEAERFRSLLVENGFEAVGCFHGDTRSQARRQLLQAWRGDELEVMVATSAFGLGVDKPDVRAVVHACFPETMHRYYQEVGRGGRDGASSICLLVPTEDDRQTADTLLPTMLGNEKIQLRWTTMLSGARHIDGAPNAVPMNAKHVQLLGSRSYGENIRWNKRLLLMMARANLVDLIDLTLEEDPDELGEFVEWVALACKFPPRESTLAERLAPQRQQEFAKSKEGIRRLDAYLLGEQRICRLLRREYGEETQVTCGSCPACRDSETDPTAVPPLQFEAHQVPSPRRDIVMTETAFDSARGLRELASRLRDLWQDYGIRHFVCTATLVEPLRKELSQLAAATASHIYRLDDAREAYRVMGSPAEGVVCIHSTEPDRQMLTSCLGARMSHLFPANARIEDTNGRVVLTQQGATHFTSYGQWIAEI
ncbi:MAG TPA: protein DpdF [Dongiaceae bacterium]|jgi:ATP-dependent DNA helicase RecQ|nr:protein DpdF [Dongiaceae bacterium]